MFLLFKGHNARHKLSKVVGDNLVCIPVSLIIRVFLALTASRQPPPSDYGRTIRGTFGDYHEIEDGTVVDFHPAVLTPNTAQSNREALRLFAEYVVICCPFSQSAGTLSRTAACSSTVPTWRRGLC